MHWGNKAKRANQDHDTKTLQVAYMVDSENISSTRSASLTHKEQEAERKHVKRMQNHEGLVGWAKQQKKRNEWEVQ